jgi:hypothetical protein
MAADKLQKFGKKCSILPHYGKIIKGKKRNKGPALYLHSLG